jgi:hypothetical protein
MSIIVFPNTFNLDPLSVNIFLFLFTMLVDTGATVTVVSINLLKHDFSYND